jgi:hypothetical protein
VITAIPIIAYHDIESSKKIPYATDVTLFAQEMKYLHDNGFRVIRVSDLGFDNKTNSLYIKNHTSNGVSSTQSRPYSY